MSFNSIGFLLIFLPLTLIGYYLLSWLRGKKLLLAYLSAVSIVFYYIGSPRSLPILLASVVFNYILAQLIFKYKGNFKARVLLVAGVCANIGSLALFKYMNFTIGNLNEILGTDYQLMSMFLPLGISFFTFKQIAYLNDVADGTIKPGSAIDHLFSVVFFPQLIAGPITLHRDLTKQLVSNRLGRFAAQNLVIGLSIFAIGLFKRTVLADCISPYADAVFDDVSEASQVPFFSAWNGALCYMMQLYFDFSGYSDMAVGVARMFGFKLPINFYSPLKATSIIDFWRRWHITLQRIIGRYFYQPLLIPISRFVAEWNCGRWTSFWLVSAAPTLMTFVLLGLWHGAGWTFILFGLLHGLYATANEAWKLLNRKRRKKNKSQPGWSSLMGFQILTLASVAFAGVLFRSANIGDALKVWAGMLDITKINLWQLTLLTSWSTLANGSFLLLVIEFFIVLCCPNTHQIFHKFSSLTDHKTWVTSDAAWFTLHWRPTLAWAVTLGLIFCIGLVFMLRVQTKFIYFNF